MFRGWITIFLLFSGGFPIENGGPTWFSAKLGRGEAARMSLVKWPWSLIGRTPRATVGRHLWICRFNNPSNHNVDPPNVTSLFINTSNYSCKYHILIGDMSQLSYLGRRAPHWTIDLLLYIYIYRLWILPYLLRKCLGHDFGEQPYLLRRCLDPWK